MLLFISSQPSRRKNYPKRTLHLKCDICNKEFEKNYFSHIEQAEYHTCSTKCQNLGQRKNCIIDVKKRQVFFDKFGVDSPLRSLEIKEKSRQTNIERYGHPFSSQSDIVKENAKLACRERYGADSQFSSENFAIKSKETWLKNYGVDHPMRSSKVKAKYDFVNLWKKAHETKKRNGTYATSSVEKKFYQRLLTLYENVEYQIRLKHSVGVWLIDFKINDVYIQFDGEYWHGLDRPINLIRESISPRDKAIVKAYDRDRIQDNWFKLNELNLVRITDRQAKTMSDFDILQLLTL